MIRINRLVKKEHVWRILNLPNVSKIEIKRGKNNLKNPCLVRILIYLSHSDKDRTHFNRVMGHVLNLQLPKSSYSIIHTALKDGFIKESTYNTLPGISKNDPYKVLTDKYSQTFFDNMLV